ncbi:MAG: hypothetical protein GY765_24445 [bacterium]|nr:hypothetical protein [bacterium]
MRFRLLLPLFFISFLLLPGEAAGLRKIKTGEKLPQSNHLKAFQQKGKKLILYIKSGDMKSIAFLKTVTGILKADIQKFKDLTVYLVDANPDTDQRVTALTEKLKLKTIVLNDGDRQIYGALGVIVVPTMLFVTGEHILHSLVAGLRHNLAMFIKGHTEALLKDQSVQDLYENADKRREELKIVSILNRAFRLLVSDNPTLAHSMYLKILKKAPQNLEAQLGTGYALFFSDNITESLAHFEQISQNPKNKRVFLGLYLCKATNEPTVENLEQLKKYARLEPAFYMVVFEAAAILEKAGKYELSTKIYKRCYRILLRSVRRGKTQ